MSNNLSGISSLSYQGTNATNPPDLTYSTRNPTQYDSSNFSLGDLWLNTTDQTIWLLVSLSGTVSSGGTRATWAELGVTLSEIETITGNSGGAVGPSISNNINIVGDGTTITVVGSPSTNTLTASLVPGSAIITLTGDSGGAVSPDSGGNFNVVGDGTSISIVGNPGTHTLTASVINSVNLTLTGNSGGAVSASAGNINVVGDGTSISIVGSPGTNTLTASIVSGGSIDSITGDTGGAILPDAGGNFNLLGTPGVISVSGNAGTHTLTIDVDSTIATSYETDSGTATPSSNILIIAGGTNINTSGSGNTVTIDLDSTLTGITDLTVDNLTVTNSADFSYLTEGVLQSDGSGNITSSEGTDGQILISSSTGAPAWATITAGANVTVTNGHNSITIAATGGGGGSGIVLLASQDVSGQTAVAFTSVMSATYTSYLLVADKLMAPVVGAGHPVNILLSSDNGSSYISDSKFRAGILYNLYNSTALNNFNYFAGNAYIAGYIFASASTQYVSFSHFLYDLTTNHYAKNLVGQFVTYNPTNLYQGQAAGTYYGGSLPNTGPVINALQVQFDGVTMTSGTIELYGLTH